MTIINKYAAESWDKVYNAFSQINFTSYSFDDVKESMLQYLQIYHAEDFNDYIESSEMIALLEIFAYAAELLSYRIDQAAHENFISTAQRKQSVLRLAKLISYSASRNIPARGLVKINTIRTDETVYDSLGNDLSGTTITWNDPDNSNWKEQFFLVMNLALTSSFGQPSKSFQISDVLMQLYTLNNTANTFRNGVFTFSATSSTDTVSMEAVPIDIDSDGPFERAPDSNSQFNIVYASDGRGDGSDYTGFLMYVKQGSLVLTNYEILEAIANRRIVLNQTNVNDTDVWVYEVDDYGAISQTWTAVSTVADETLAYNNTTSRYKYEIETLENDQIALLFGDGNFSEVPVGKFQLWTRVSVNQDITIPKSKISGQAMSFTYSNDQNVTQTFNLTFSLTSALQNNSASETIEHVRQSAPSTYYSQNRMVNGQDYNTFMLQDSTILKLNTINRTFAGQPKYLDWNDASGAYQNIKLFGDDLTMSLDISVDLVETTTSSKGIIDSYIEPMLSSNAILNMLTHQTATDPDSYGIVSYPRRQFIEDNQKTYYDLDGNFIVPYGVQLDDNALQVGDGSLLEKTVIQAALDGHWYGEPTSTVTINETTHGVIPDPILYPESNSKLYIADLPRTIDGVNTYPPGDVGSGLQSVQRQKYFGLKYNNFLKGFGDGTIALYDPENVLSSTSVHGPAPAVGLDSYYYKSEVITIEMTSDGTTFTVISNLRGKLPNYSLTLAAASTYGKWSEQNTDVTLPIDFAITTGTTEYSAGDAFIVDISNTNTVTPITPTWVSNIRTFGTSDSTTCVNLNGWWQLIPADVVTTSTTADIPGIGIFTDGSGDGPNTVQQMMFDKSTSGSSWIFLIARTDDSSGDVSSWSIYSRNAKIVASSPTTNFWFNQDNQIIDSQTKKPVYDKIRVLRSNIDAYGQPLKKADIYDCVGFVYDSDGQIITNEIELLPADTINYVTDGDSTPDNILQFEEFSIGAYKYTLLNVTDPSNPTVVSVLSCGSYKISSGYDVASLDVTSYDTGEVNDYYVTAITVTGYDESFVFLPGNFISSVANSVYQLIRQKYVPAPAVSSPITSTYGCNAISGLDFMWQHYTPDTNLIDPSVSNIHDAYILTRGYYTSMKDYTDGTTSVEPDTPTSLELRTSYGYLLDNKMLSDTVVLHSGKIKLLFGSLADQELRAKFRVVVSQSATFSNERIKQEIVNTIDTYFSIDNWDFGSTFYATELLSLIHQALPTQISSVVIVPTYSVNSFGSLFTINSGLDEVLQSCATISDIEIVSALTSTNLRQNV